MPVRKRGVKCLSRVEFATRRGRRTKDSRVDGETGASDDALLVLSDHYKQQVHVSFASSDRRMRYFFFFCFLPIDSTRHDRLVLFLPSSTGDVFRPLRAQDAQMRELSNRPLARRQGPVSPSRLDFLLARWLRFPRCLLVVSHPHSDRIAARSGRREREMREREGRLTSEKTLIGSARVPSRSIWRGSSEKASSPLSLCKSSNRSSPVACSMSVGTSPVFPPGPGGCKIQPCEIGALFLNSDRTYRGRWARRPSNGGAK